MKLLNKILIPTCSLIATLTPVCLSACGGQPDEPVDPEITEPTEVEVAHAVDIKDGKVQKLEYKVLPEGVSQEVEGKSENPEVAFVTKDGVIVPISAGEATIVVTPKGYDLPATCVVKVTEEQEAMVSTRHGFSKNWIKNDFDWMDPHAGADMTVEQAKETYGSLVSSSEEQYGKKIYIQDFLHFFAATRTESSLYKDSYVSFLLKSFSGAGGTNDPVVSFSVAYHSNTITEDDDPITIKNSLVLEFNNIPLTFYHDMGNQTSGFIYPTEDIGGLANHSDWSFKYYEYQNLYNSKESMLEDYTILADHNTDPERLEKIIAGDNIQSQSGSLAKYKSRYFGSVRGPVNP